MNLRLTQLSNIKNIEFEKNLLNYYKTKNLNKGKVKCQKES